MTVKLYSTHCPKCNVIAAKLKQKNVEFELIDNFDIQELIDKGFRSAPILVVDDNYMDFTKANEWVKEYKS